MLLWFSIQSSDSDSSLNLSDTDLSMVDLEDAQALIRDMSDQLRHLQVCCAFYFGYLCVCDGSICALYVCFMCVVRQG